MKIQIINGPNLNMLGIREPHIYGSLTLQEMNERIGERAEELQVEVAFFQSNHEGEIVEKIHRCYGQAQGIIINPAAYTHYSIAIRDALATVGIKTIEVHLSDISQREDFRKHSVIKDVCHGQISGKGLNSYIEALEVMAAEAGLKE